ncbi:hypothetical protein ACHMW6_14280 [Pseudoduganella sp. UC29_106]|uniref:hypothetical protein n=1 Tax=Pseudoduganella sp. UC29_106 TaxID=3374553 RepID=UPI003756CD92
MKSTTAERKLQERLLLAREVPGDRLMLSDGVLLAALEGSRALDAAQLAALQASPLTLKRFRHLALERRRAEAPAGTLPWRGSAGMLRAASTAVALDGLVTDDGCWSLHFLPEGDGWQVILKLEAKAEFAAQLMRERPLLRVLDGQGAVVLQGRLDADGECERPWPFDAAPFDHFQRYGARFAVAPAGR